MSETMELENLGLLKLTKTSRLFVGLLPTKYKALIINYSGDVGYNRSNIQVSCVLPPTSHNVQIVYELNESIQYDDYDVYDRECETNKDIGKLKTLKHLAPATLFSIGYPDVPNYATSISEGQIFIFDTKHKNKINLIGYQLPNVSEDGLICFGDLKPRDLRSAYNMFWDSPFNNSMYGDYAADVKSNFEYVKRYKTLVLKKQKFEDCTDLICGTKFWSTEQKADGVLITTNTELLQQIPNKYWLRESGGSAFLIVLADRQDDKWVFRSKKFQFEIDDGSITTSQSENKKLITAVKKVLPKKG